MTNETRGGGGATLEYPGVATERRQRDAWAARPRLAAARISVVIASFGRNESLHETILSLLSQDEPPLEIIVAVPDLRHIDGRTMSLPRVMVVCSERGSCHQRNAGVRALSPDSGLVAFFDDDVELDCGYLARMQAMMDRHPEVAIATGLVLADGARTGGIAREEARRIVDAGVSEDDDDVGATEPEDVHGAYGCNMVCRREVAERIRFDERLPLYGWLEDFDYSHQASRFGRVVRFGASRCVHLAQQTGRVSGFRFGYSQIVNPCYLMLKGNRITVRSLLGTYWLPVLLRNAVSCGSRMRRQRLIGNLRGLAMVLRGRVEPEGVLDIGS